MFIITNNLISKDLIDDNLIIKSPNCPIDINTKLNIYDIKQIMPNKFRLVDEFGTPYFEGYHDSEIGNVLEWGLNMNCTGIQYWDYSQFAWTSFLNN